MPDMPDMPDFNLERKNIYQLQWQDIPSKDKNRLIYIHGEPVFLSGIKLEIGDRQRHGTCEANEASIAALAKDPLYWGYYNLAVVGPMVLWRLELTPRLMTSKIIVGENGGLILPGMIYTEQRSHDDYKSIDEFVTTHGTRHQLSSRGGFTTFNFPEGEDMHFKLTPIRYMEPQIVTTHSFTLEISERTIDEIVQEATIAALQDQDEAYEVLYLRLPALFEKASNPNVLNVRLKNMLLPLGEINMPIDEMRSRISDTQIALPPNSEYPAILDPVAWNDRGEQVYILETNDKKYYFCPNNDCEVIK